MTAEQDKPREGSEVDEQEHAPTEGTDEKSDEEVEEASKDSFPASDPPAW